MSYMPYFRLLSYLYLFFGIPHAYGQIYLQYEQANSIKVTKYGPGEQITFKTIHYPDYWLKGEIYKILPDEKALVFDDRITYLKDITHFRYYRTWPKAIGTNLMRFGSAWFLFAGIIEGGRATGVLESNYNFGTDTAIIGGTALIGGSLTRALWGTATKPINGHNRLIIIDLRF